MSGSIKGCLGVQDGKGRYLVAWEIDGRFHRGAAAVGLALMPAACQGSDDP